MRFLHLGDLHLGKSLQGFDLYEDQKYILNQLLEIASEKQVDAILIAGDIYDRTIPGEMAVQLLDDFLSRAQAQGLEIFVITGNHDSDERLNFGSRLLDDKGIHIYAKFDGKARRYVLHDARGEVNLYLLPFVKASQVRWFYPEEEIKSYDEAVRVVLAHSEIDPNARNVLVAHQFVAGLSEDPQIGGSEGVSVKHVGLVEKIGADCFEAFDYVALGHIHSAQSILRPEIRYAGSPLKYSMAEAMHRKAATVVTLDDAAEIELVPLEPLRDVRHVRGELRQLLAKENTMQGLNDFLYVTLTDEEPVEDPMRIFQQIFPNTVHIDFDNSGIRSILNDDTPIVTEDKSFSEMIAEFYALMYGTEISEEELAMMEEVAREAGVLHAAD